MSEQNKNGNESPKVKFVIGDDVDSMLEVIKNRNAKSGQASAPQNPTPPPAASRTAKEPISSSLVPPHVPSPEQSPVTMAAKPEEKPKTLPSNAEPKNQPNPKDSLTLSEAQIDKGVKKENAEAADIFSLFSQYAGTSDSDAGKQKNTASGANEKDAKKNDVPALFDTSNGGASVTDAPAEKEQNTDYTLSSDNLFSELFGEDISEKDKADHTTDGQRASASGSASDRENELENTAMSVAKAFEDHKLSSTSSIPVIPTNGEKKSPVSAKKAAPRQQGRNTGKTHVVDFDEIDPENARRRKTKQLKKNVRTGAGAALGLIKVVVYVAVVLFISVFLAVKIRDIIFDIYALDDTENFSAEIEIPKDATVEEVAEILTEAGIIDHPTVFSLYTKREFDGSKYLTGEFKAGKHLIEFKVADNDTGNDTPQSSFIQLAKDEDSAYKPLNYDRIISILAVSTYKQRETVRVTIPEGYTVEQIVELLTSKGVGSKEEFYDVIENYEYDYRFVKSIPDNPDRLHRLEGYLFPDTYDFFTDESEISVINKMLSNFESKFEDQYYEKAETMGMSVDDFIIIASIIEKEAKFAKDHPIISSVFHNRLASSSGYTRLESDATVLYIGEDATAEEKAASPYNSYVTYGLIPGPISNPGIEAISAAFYPENTNYLYFFSKKDGTTVFNTNLADHESAVAKARADGTYATQKNEDE